MTIDNTRRILNWGAIRSETLSGGDGSLVLQGTEADGLDQLAEEVKGFVLAYGERFGLARRELRHALLDSEWLLGYVAGACIAAVRGAGGTSDTTLVGFASRVCGELAGGGARRKLAAYEHLSASGDHPDFQQGSADAQLNWADRSRVA